MRASRREPLFTALFLTCGSFPAEDHIFIDRIEQAVEEHYKTLALRPEFTSAVRTLMKAAIDDQSGTQRMLQEQTRSQLARLAVQEDNLIDLAADGGIDTSRVRAKLRDIARQRNELEAELNSVTDDIRPGMAYIEAHLDLLKDPHELYRFASDQTRRMLNQAIFKHIYVVNEEVVGDELSSPLCEVLASQRGWEAFQTTGDAVHAHELAAAEAHLHDGVQKAKQATVSDGLLDDFLTALLPDGAETVANCSRTSMVRLLGRYLNSSPEVAKLRDLCSRAAEERVERTYSSPNRAVPRLTMSQNEEIVKLYQDGMRPADIARRIGTTEWTVHHRLNRMGVERRVVGLSPGQILEAQRLYEAGESLRQIGLKIGFNDKTVKKALVDAGVDVQDRRRKH